jgi:signal transduction histidine kinase
MRREFENEVKIVRFLEGLEKQLGRIQHSLTIIPLLRGDARNFNRFMSKIDARCLVDGTIKAVKKEFETADSITFRVDGTSFSIKADPQMLEQALSYILKNSIEAIQEAKLARGLISISLTISNDMAAFEIVDNGCGIPEENVPRLGELFTSKDYGSVNRGMGLFRAAKILDVHDGALKITSEPGKGTSVSVILPLWIDS